DAVPALMAGNSVVMKPSEITPLSSLLIAEGLRQVGMPDDVLLVATGTGETGAALVDEADMIMFTGSTRTGKKIMAGAAETVRPTLPIMKVRDENEALHYANDSRYGLNSSVFTRDVEKGERIARELTAGNACVNDALVNYGATELPFGGTRESGIGVRHGA